MSSVDVLPQSIPTPIKGLLEVGYAADKANDSKITVPYMVEQETFPIPQACPDSATGLWVPGQDLYISYFSWNMGQFAPSASEVATSGVLPNAHIICVCTQENGPYVGTNKAHNEWKAMVTTECLGGAYTLVAEKTMWAVQVLVFARSKDVAMFVREVDVGEHKTGFANGLMGNKGGVGVGLAVSLRQSTANRVLRTVSPSVVAVVPRQPSSDQRVSSAGEQYSPRDGLYQENSAKPDKQELTVLFIGAHLTAHQHNVEKRNDDYLQIVRHMSLGLRGAFAKKFAVAMPPTPDPNERDVTDEYDVCFFGGDLNYRIKGTKSGIEYIVNHQKQLRAVLVANDQLSAERAKSIVFKRFSEGQLNFRPTYKYHIDKKTKKTEDIYDFNTKKLRLPSYTDRILHKKNPLCRSTMDLVLYTDCPEVRSSDHRPVVGLFKATTDMFPDGDTVEPPPVEPSRKSGACCC